MHVIPASAAGLTGSGSQLWGQDSTGIMDGAEADDGFGSSVATGDFNGDPSDELAIGFPARTSARSSTVAPCTSCPGRRAG